MSAAIRTGMASQDAQVRRMLALEAGVARLQAQISSGKRVALPSDAPVDAARIGDLARALADDRQTLRNIEVAAARLTLAADTAAQGQNLVGRARDLALAAGSESANADDRLVAAREIDLIVEQMQALAGSRDASGRSLFDDTPIPVGDGRTVASETAASLFGDSLADLATLSAALREPDITLRRTGLDTGLAALDAATARLAEGEARLGATLARLDDDRARLAERAVDLTATRGALEDTDIAKAATDLQRLLTLLEATRQTQVRVQSTTLFDLLR
jgi:flagellar hook-associated protein 3 FlgL